MVIKPLCFGNALTVRVERIGDEYELIRHLEGWGYSYSISKELYDALVAWQKHLDDYWGENQP